MHNTSDSSYRLCFGSRISLGVVIFMVFRLELCLVVFYAILPFRVGGFVEPYSLTLTHDVPIDRVHLFNFVSVCLIIVILCTVMFSFLCLSVFFLLSLWTW
jgi:hypothetical protein